MLVACTSDRLVPRGLYTGVGSLAAPPAGSAYLCTAEAFLVFLLRHQNIAKPMAARAAMPPMTGPAIHALLGEEPEEVLSLSEEAMVA